MGGGSGGGDGGAAEREAARKARVDSSVKAINALFIDPETGEMLGSRKQALDDVGEKVQQRFMPEFQRDTKNARQQLKFALARRGLEGGSEQIDARGRLQQRVADTERDIAQKAIVARTEAERGQQNLLDNLIAQAQADTDQSILLNQASSGQNAAINRAVETAKMSALPNAFQDVGTLFRDIVDRNTFNQGLRQGLSGTAFRANTPSTLFGSGSSNSGVETPA
tara:strand:- start:74 stop:745 length:672 start_codon:yes stop_codon:yes gene_type:complete